MRKLTVLTFGCFVLSSVLCASQPQETGNTDNNTTQGSQPDLQTLRELRLRFLQGRRQPHTHSDQQSASNSHGNTGNNDDSLGVLTNSADPNMQNSSASSSVGNGAASDNAQTNTHQTFQQYHNVNDEDNSTSNLLSGQDGGYGSDEDELASDEEPFVYNPLDGRNQSSETQGGVAQLVGDGNDGEDIGTDEAIARRLQEELDGDQNGGQPGNPNANLSDEELARRMQHEEQNDGANNQHDDQIVDIEDLHRLSAVDSDEGFEGDNDNQQPAGVEVPGNHGNQENAGNNQPDRVHNDQADRNDVDNNDGERVEQPDRHNDAHNQTVYTQVRTACRNFGTQVYDNPRISVAAALGFTSAVYLGSYAYAYCKGTLPERLSKAEKRRAMLATACTLGSMFYIGYQVMAQ